MHDDHGSYIHEQQRAIERILARMMQVAAIGVLSAWLGLGLAMLATMGG